MAKSTLTFVQAVAQARASHHGSRDYQDAETVLYREYREANPDKANQFIPIEALWSWIRERLSSLNNSKEN